MAGKIDAFACYTVTEIDPLHRLLPGIGEGSEIIVILVPIWKIARESFKIVSSRVWMLGAIP